jgi:hypothetical protein
MTRWRRNPGEARTMATTAACPTYSKEDLERVITAWEWTTLATEKLCALWRPVAQCYLEKGTPSFTLPAPRPIPPCA